MVCGYRKLLRVDCCQGELTAWHLLAELPTPIVAVLSRSLILISKCKHYLIQGVIGFT